MNSLNEYKDVNDSFWPLVTINEADLIKLISGEEVQIGDFKVKIAESSEDLNQFLDITEGILLEKRVRQTKRMKNSNKVVSATTEQLFGPAGKYEQQVKKIFTIFKSEVRKKSQEMGVPTAQVRQWKIILRDHDNNDYGKTI